MLPQAHPDAEIAAALEAVINELTLIQRNTECEAMFLYVDRTCGFALGWRGSLPLGPYDSIWAALDSFDSLPAHAEHALEPDQDLRHALHQLHEAHAGRCSHEPDAPIEFVWLLRIKPGTDEHPEQGRYAALNGICVENRPKQRMLSDLQIFELVGCHPLDRANPD